MLWFTGAISRHCLKDLTKSISCTFSQIFDSHGPHLLTQCVICTPPHTAERMNRTLVQVTGAQIVLLASGLKRSWWHHAVMYQTFLQNIKYSSLTKSSLHLLMLDPSRTSPIFRNLARVWKVGCIVVLTSVLTQILMPAGNLLFL